MDSGLNSHPSRLRLWSWEEPDTPVPVPVDTAQHCFSGACLMIHEEKSLPLQSATVY